MLLAFICLFFWALLGPWAASPQYPSLPHGGMGTRLTCPSISLSLPLDTVSASEVNNITKEQSEPLPEIQMGIGDAELD